VEKRAASQTLLQHQQVSRVVAYKKRYLPRPVSPQVAEVYCLCTELSGLHPFVALKYCHTCPNQATGCMAAQEKRSVATTTQTYQKNLRIANREGHYSLPCCNVYQNNSKRKKTLGGRRLGMGGRLPGRGFYCFHGLLVGGSYRGARGSTLVSALNAYGWTLLVCLSSTSCVQCTSSW